MVVVHTQTSASPHTRKPRRTQAQTRSRSPDFRRKRSRRSLARRVEAMKPLTQPEHERGSSALRSLIPGVYAPWTAVALGLGILLVALPLYLLEVGLSFTATSVVLAAAGFGSFAGAIPSGGAIARFGEGRTIAISLVLAAVAIGLTATSSNPIALTTLQLAVGAAATAMRLASLTTITRSVPARGRGRANSMMGGIRRFGSFVGPLTGGVLVDQIGFNATFLIAAAVTATGLLPLARAARRTSASDIVPERHAVGLLRALRQHRRILLLSASGPFLIMAARRGRSVLLPLVAAALEVSPTAVGAIVAIGMGADLMLFPVAGWIMDRFGRLRAIGPAFTADGDWAFRIGCGRHSHWSGDRWCTHRCWKWLELWHHDDLGLRLGAKRITESVHCWFQRSPGWWADGRAVARRGGCRCVWTRGLVGDPGCLVACGCRSDRCHRGGNDQRPGSPIMAFTRALSP